MKCSVLPVRRQVGLAAAFFWWMALSAATASPPAVVRATPDHADLDVDPGMTEMRIEFDQDMSPAGHSICGSKENLPEIIGKPRWETPRVFVIPVKMSPGRRYDFSVNCQSNRNFKGVAGESAVPYQVSFRTSDKPGGGGAKLTPEQNGAAIAALRKAFDERYSYRNLHKVDWEARFAEFEPRLLSAETPSAFTRELVRLLSAAKDTHVSVRVGEFTLPTHWRYYDANWNEQTLRRLVAGFTDKSPVVATGTLDGGFGYILIRSWGGAAEDYEPLYETLDELKNAPGLVIDVRPNGGGDELLAREFASCFTRSATLYSRNTSRKPGTKDEFAQVLDRIVQPSVNRPTFKGPTVVLMGPANLSSNESFLLMMKHGGRSKLVGGRSGGSSGNPRPYDLGNGVTVMLSSWKDLLPDGSTLEGVGIKPDEAMELKFTDFVADDPVLKKALELLAKKVSG